MVTKLEIRCCALLAMLCRSGSGKTLTDLDGVVGDEFLLLMPNIDSQQAEQAMKRIQEDLSNASAPFQITEEVTMPIRFSYGIAELDPNSDDSLAELIALADQRMYQDKGQQTSVAI